MAHRNFASGGGGARAHPLGTPLLQSGFRYCDVRLTHYSKLETKIPVLHRFHSCQPAAQSTAQRMLGPLAEQDSLLWSISISSDAHRLPPPIGADVPSGGAEDLRPEKRRLLGATTSEGRPPAQKIPSPPGHHLDGAPPGHHLHANQ